MTKSVQFVNDEKNCKFLSLLGKDMKIEKMSAFERFAFFADNLDLAIGSRVKREFISALSFDLKAAVPDDVYLDREDQKAIWRRINGDNNAEINIAKTSNRSTYKNHTDEGKISKINISDFLKSIKKDGARITELGDLISKVAEYGAIVLETADFVYRRPDEYHSRLALKKIISDEPYSKEEISLLEAWIICRVLMQKNAKLYLVANKDISELKKLLELLDSRELCPFVYICFSDAELCADVGKICLEAEQKNISPKIIISEEIENDDILFLIRSLASELPFTLISEFDFSGSNTARKKFYEARECFIKAEEEI